MASPPKILKTAAGTPIQVPVPYVFTDSIQVSQLFPNVFNRQFLTCERKLDVLRAMPKYFKVFRLTGNFSTSGLDLHVVARPEPVLLPEGNGVKETDRILLMFAAWHYSSTDENLAIMSMSLVDQTGGHILTPDFEIYESRPTVDKGAARVIKWIYPLASLWNNKDNFFPDGTLRIKYQVGQDFSQELGVLPQSLSTLSNNMLDLLKSGEKSDFTIKCGPSEFNVHEIILASRSPVFRAMFSHNMSENNNREMTIPDVEPDVFEVLLQFVYSSIVEPEKIEFKKLCGLISAADKYQLTELKNICFSYITKNISLENIGDISLLAYHHSASEELQKKVSDFVEANYKSLRNMAEFKEVMRECLDMFWNAKQAENLM